MTKENLKKLCGQMNHIIPCFVLTEDIDFCKARWSHEFILHCLNWARFGSIIMQDMLFWHESGPLVFTWNKYTTMQYLDILTDQVHPPMLQFNSTSDGHFKDNNTTIHYARITWDWFTKHQSGFKQLLRLSQNPVLI